MRFRDKTGKRFGSLVAKRFEKRNKRYWYYCLCDCGNSVWIVGGNLHWTDSGTRSCGCSKDGNPTHGMSGTPEHKAWKAMWQRCTNPNDTVYHHYGGRGIRVCKRWESFENFLEDMGPRPEGKFSVDRINVNGHYSPSNCRWATIAQQRRNRRDSIRITYKGETLQADDWATKTGIPVSRIKARFRKGYPPYKILSVTKLNPHDFRN